LKLSPKFREIKFVSSRPSQGAWIETLNPSVYRCKDCRVVKTVPESEDAGDLPVFDLEVDHPDHLFVLANGLVSCNSKYSGGIRGAQASKAVSGFKVINQLLQVPKVYLNGATHTDTDGTVTDIREVPSGWASRLRWNSTLHHAHFVWFAVRWKIFPIENQFLSTERKTGNG
jgi:hypothetical protein